VGPVPGGVEPSPPRPCQRLAAQQFVRPLVAGARPVAAGPGWVHRCLEPSGQMAPLSLEPETSFPDHRGGAGAYFAPPQPPSPGLRPRREAGRPVGG
jgi:hypothetical protein